MPRKGYLVFAKTGSTLAEQDWPGGGARVRIVTFRGDATRRVICRFQGGWPEYAAIDWAERTTADLALPADELEVVEVTPAEFNDVEGQVHSGNRAATEALKESRRVALRSFLASSVKRRGDVGPNDLVLSFSTPADAVEFFKALYLKMREVEASLDKEF
jgi:hypothetical protein